MTRRGMRRRGRPTQGGGFGSSRVYSTISRGARAGGSRGNDKNGKNSLYGCTHAPRPERQRPHPLNVHYASYIVACTVEFARSRTSFASSTRQNPHGKERAGASEARMATATETTPPRWSPARSFALRPPPHCSQLSLFAFCFLFYLPLFYALPQPMFVPV